MSRADLGTDIMDASTQPLADPAGPQTDATAITWARAACHRAVPSLLEVARGRLTLAVMGDPGPVVALLAQVGRLIGRPFGTPLPLCLPGWDPGTARALLRTSPGLETLFQPMPDTSPSRPLLVFNAAAPEASANALIDEPIERLAGRRAVIVHPPPAPGTAPDTVAMTLLEAGLIGLPVSSGMRGRRSDALVLLDRLAATIHGFYLENAWTRGEALGSTPALRPWERLPETYRASNRAQADHLFLKLEAAGLIALPEARAGDDDAVAAPAWGQPAQVERLATLEHNRWCGDRLLDGWTHGPTRDNDRKVHPDLLPYETLGEDVKEKDRVAVLTVPLILRLAGLAYRPVQPVRLRGPWPWGGAAPGLVHRRRLLRSAAATANERAPMVPEYVAAADEPGACAAALTLARAGAPVALEDVGLDTLPGSESDPDHRRRLVALIPHCRRLSPVADPETAALVATWQRGGLTVDRAPALAKDGP